MKILVFGTYDLLHEGHKFFLKRAKEYGDYLTVIVARDKTVKIIKGFYPDNDENLRLKNIQELNIVDKAILGNEDNDKYKIIEKIKPEVIIIGYDQTAFVETLNEELISRGLACKVLKLSDSFNPKKYKSSIIRNK